MIGLYTFYIEFKSVKFKDSKTVHSPKASSFSDYHSQRDESPYEYCVIPATVRNKEEDNFTFYLEELQGWILVS